MPYSLIFDRDHLRSNMGTIFGPESYLRLNFGIICGSVARFSKVDPEEFSLTEKLG